jgi:hypothetical protein
MFCGVDFVCSIPERDPRSGGFISREGEPTLTDLSRFAGADWVADTQCCCRSFCTRKRYPWFMLVRNEQLEDRAAIRDVLIAAFPRQDEADLVDRLRSDGDSELSLVAIEADAIVGHILFSKLNAPLRALALAPGGCGAGKTALRHRQRPDSRRAATSRSPRLAGCICAGGRAFLPPIRIRCGSRQRVHIPLFRLTSWPREWERHCRLPSAALNTRPLSRH